MKKILFTLALLISFNSFGQTEKISDLSSDTHRGKMENEETPRFKGYMPMTGAKFSYPQSEKYDEYRDMVYNNISDGNYYEAIKYATKALNIKPKNLNCRFRCDVGCGCIGDRRIRMNLLRAKLLTAVGNYSAALADYSQVIWWNKHYSKNNVLIASNFETYVLRGNLLSSMGKNELACSDWNEAEKAYKDLEEGYSIYLRPAAGTKSNDYGKKEILQKTTITTYTLKSGKSFTSEEEMTYEKIVDIINNNCAEDMRIIKNDYKADKYLQSGVDKANRLEDHYGAIADYTKAIELLPNDAIAYYNRGLSKDILGDISGAMADYDKAIELDPNDDYFYSNRGGIKIDLEDYYGAISDYSKVIELNPNDADAYYNRGISKFELGDYYGAINDYSKTIELDTDNADAYYNRSLSKKLLGDLNGACKDAKIAFGLGYNVEWMSDCN